jgi:hypothetical protein
VLACVVLGVFIGLGRMGWVDYDEWLRILVVRESGGPYYFGVRDSSFPSNKVYQYNHIVSSYSS